MYHLVHLNRKQVYPFLSTIKHLFISNTPKHTETQAKYSCATMILSEENRSLRVHLICLSLTNYFGWIGSHAVSIVHFLAYKNRYCNQIILFPYLLTLNLTNTCFERINNRYFVYLSIQSLKTQGIQQENIMSGLNNQRDVIICP